MADVVPGNNGTNDVLSFVAPSTTDSWNFGVMDFVRHTVSRGLAQDSWYLTVFRRASSPGRTVRAWP